MSEPQNDDITATGIAMTVRSVERRLRWMLVVIAVFILFVLVVGGFSLTSVIVAIIAALFLGAAYLVLRSFASIGRRP